MALEEIDNRAREISKLETKLAFEIGKVAKLRSQIHELKSVTKQSSPVIDSNSNAEELENLAEILGSPELIEEHCSFFMNC